MKYILYLAIIGPATDRETSPLCSATSDLLINRENRVESLRQSQGRHKATTANYCIHGYNIYTQFSLS